MKRPLCLLSLRTSGYGLETVSWYIVGQFETGLLFLINICKCIHAFLLNFQFINFDHETSMTHSFSIKITNNNIILSCKMFVIDWLRDI